MTFEIYEGISDEAQCEAGETDQVMWLNDDAEVVTFCARDSFHLKGSDRYYWGREAILRAEDRKEEGGGEPTGGEGVSILTF